MTYTQAALALDAAPRHPPDDLSPVSVTRAGWSAVLRHTPTPSGRRMLDDEWNEYRLECAMRDARVVAATRCKPDRVPRHARLDGLPRGDRG